MNKSVLVLLVAFFAVGQAFLGVEFANLPYDISVCDSDPRFDIITSNTYNTPQVYDSGVLCFPDVVTCVACLEYFNNTYRNHLVNSLPIFLPLGSIPCLYNSYIPPGQMWSKTNTSGQSYYSKNFPSGSGASFGIRVGDSQFEPYNFTNIISPTNGKSYGIVYSGNTCNTAGSNTFMCTNPAANKPAFKDPSSLFYTGKLYPHGGTYFGCRAVQPTYGVPYNASSLADPQPTRNFTEEGQLIGDPHFVGFDGSKFDFFGVPNMWFNIISDVTFQMNSYLVSYGSENSYMTKLGFLAGASRISYDTAKNLTVNGEPVKLPFTNQDISVSQEQSYIVFQTPVYKIKVKIVENSDGQFLNVRSSIVSMPSRPHGILGQTAKFLVEGSKPQPRKATNKQGAGVIEGNHMDYLVRDGQFGKDFRFNHFTGAVEGQGFNRRRSTMAMEVSANIVNK